MRQRMLLLLLLLAGACIHTHEPMPTEEPTETVKPPKIKGQPPLSLSPAEMLAPGGAQKIQEALTQKGFPVPADGKFGPATEARLREFQKQQHLPETGMPDQATVRRLGLNPEEIFKSNHEPKPDHGSSAR